MAFTVNPTSPGAIIGTYGHPRKHPRLASIDFERGDFAIVANSQPGAIYSLRPKSGQEPDPFEAEVIAARALLQNSGGNGVKKLRQIVNHDGFEVEKQRSKERDGASLPLYVLH